MRNSPRYSVGLGERISTAITFGEGPAALGSGEPVWAGCVLTSQVKEHVSHGVSRWSAGSGLKGLIAPGWVWVADRGFGFMPRDGANTSASLAGGEEPTYNAPLEERADGDRQSPCSAPEPRHPAPVPPARWSVPRAPLAMGPITHPPPSPRPAPAITGGMPATAAMWAMNQPPRCVGERAWQRRPSCPKPYRPSRRAARWAGWPEARSQPPRFPRRLPVGPLRPVRSRSRYSVRSSRRPVRVPPVARRSAPRVSTVTGHISHPSASPRLPPASTGGMPAMAATPAMNRPPRRGGR